MDFHPAEDVNSGIEFGIFEKIQEAIVVEDSYGTILFANSVFEKLCGYSIQEIVHSKLELFISAIERNSAVKLQIKEEESHDQLATLKTSSGLDVYVSIRFIPFGRDETNNSGRIIFIKTAAAGKQNSKYSNDEAEVIQSLINVSGNGILLHEDGIITNVNQAFLKVFGYQAEQVVGKAMSDFVREVSTGESNITLPPGSITTVEKELTNANGENRSVEITERVVMFQGKSLNVVNISDIISIKKNALEWERLVEIIEHSPFFIATMDKIGLGYLNMAGRRLMGFKPGESYRNIALKDLMIEESARLVNEVALPAAVRKGMWKGRVILCNRSNEQIPCYLTIIPHRNEKNVVDYFSSIAEDITERLKTEQTLIDSRERLKYFMEESLEAIIIHENGIIVDFNSASFKMFGFKPDEMRGMEMRLLYDTTFNKEIIQRVNSKQVYTEQLIGVKKEGLRFDIEIYSRPHQYKGKDVRVVSILDISERKKAERALRSSELLLNTAVEGTNVGIWEWNLVTNQVAFNHVKKKIYGFTDDTAYEYFDQWVASMHPEDSPHFIAHLKSHMNLNSPLFHAVYRVKNANGNWIYLESKGKIVRDENNLPVRCVGTTIDITVRQQMENDLRQSKAQLTALIENRFESIWSVDLNKKLVNFNKPFATVFKALYNIELKAGNLITEGLKDEDAEFWVNKYNECVGGKSLTFIQEYVIAGNKIFVEFTANPVKLPDQTIVGVSVMGRDITSQIAFEESLRESKNQAEVANKSKSQFLANISHEIRTPMNGIMGFTDLLLQSKLNPQQREYLEIVRFSGNSLLNLINDLLDLSKIESGKMMLVERQFDFARLIRDIVRSFKAKAQAQQLKVVSFIDFSIPKILVGDAQRFQQIYVNLLSNAIKFSENGKVSLRAQLKETIEDQVTIYSEVEDEGIGIPEDKHDAIFDAFNQVGDPYISKFGGTGLGLSITKRLVNLMHGEIGVKSEPGKGTTIFFTIRLKIPS